MYSTAPAPAPNAPFLLEVVAPPDSPRHSQKSDASASADQALSNQDSFEPVDVPSSSKSTGPNLMSSQLPESQPRITPAASHDAPVGIAKLFAAPTTLQPATDIPAAPEWVVAFLNYSKSRNEDGTCDVPAGWEPLAPIVSNDQVGILMRKKATQTQLR